MATPAEMYRRALVVGNSAYTQVPALKNPVNDANALGAKLVGLGFETRVELDLTADGFRRVLSEFARDLAVASEKGAATSAVLFYAGHGVQVDGENYLLPVDCAVANKLDLKQQTIQLDVVLEAMGSVARTGIVMLDCCRNNPLPQTLAPASRGLSAAQGLANVKAPKGVYVAYATQPHFVALDGTGDNSPFTEALLDHVEEPGKPISEVMMAVRREVYDKTQGHQIPWDHSALFEPFAFAQGGVTREGMTPEEWDKQTKAEAKEREESYWQIVKRSNDLDFIRSFVTQFPNSPHRQAAADRVEALIVRRRRRRAIPWVIAGALGLVVLYAAQVWWRMQILPDADIIGGDIEQSNGFTGYETTEWGCRIGCFFDRFDHPCVGYSYVPSTKQCYPKYEAMFFARPSKTKAQHGSVEVNSAIMPGRALPTETSFIMHWDRALSGNRPPPEDVLKAPGPERQMVEEADTQSKFYLIKSGGECQKLCSELGPLCRGFSYTRSTSRCDLLQDVRGLVRDAATGLPVAVPGTVTGFTACMDKKTPECADAPVSTTTRALTGPPVPVPVPATPPSAAPGTGAETKN